MSSSSYYDIGNTLATGTIIAIAVGSVIGLVILITFIVIVVCIIKQSNTRRAMFAQRMMVQQAAVYPYFNSYPPNTMNVANYSSPFQPNAPPNTAPISNYT